MEERRQGNMEMVRSIATLTEEIKGIGKDITELKDRVGIQNGRIFKIEKWQAFIYGGCALMGIIMSVVSTIVMIKK